jgi:hypothetical protein
MLPIATTRTSAALASVQEPAPIVLFAHRRPEHLRRTVESLLKNAEAPETHITIYCDAAKRTEHQAAVDAVRRYVDGISGFASVTRVHRAENRGLAKSIISGVTQALTESDRVIVMEDDLVVSPFFLRYMNDGLTRYRDDEQVASVHGYWFPIHAGLPETFFLKGADCWGWATWARAWRHFEPDGKRLLEEVRRRGLAHEIDYDGTHPHMTMLKRHIAGRNDSWSIRWHVTCYLKGMLTLYPSRSVVDNIGHDNSGTHCAESEVYSGEISTERIPVDRIEPIESQAAREAAIAFYRDTKESLLWKALKRVRSRFPAFQTRSSTPS